MCRITRRITLIVVIICICTIATDTGGRGDERRQPKPVQIMEGPVPPPFLGPAALDYVTVAEFDFDDGGAPDSQGWTSHDQTAQSGVFWHVDDFDGLGGGSFGALVPITGHQSLWCGVSPGDPGTCHYATLPGYGNGWVQIFESNEFTITGDVSIQFDAMYDSEYGYDWTKVEYKSATGHWNTLADYLWEESNGDPHYEYVNLGVLGDSLAGKVEFRITFASDGGYSDEDGLWDSDGAVIIDNLVIRDNTGVVDSQDFEAEGVGDTGTLDGDWRATVSEAYGDYAALFDGAAVLQEDPLTTNLTHLWGFFNGSTYDYSCGGHPGQTVVPYGRSTDWGDIYILNTVESPWISLAPAATMISNGGKLYLEFDVYTDLPGDNGVYYDWSVRTRVGGCAQPWGFFDSVNVRYTVAEWRRLYFDITFMAQTGATEIQVALVVRDICGYACPTQASGDCHSHAPLYDNVAVRAYIGVDTLVVTNTNGSGAGSLEEAISLAYPIATPSVILFDIPGPGPHVIQEPYGITARHHLTIDGRSQPGYAGTPLIIVEGTYDESGDRGLAVTDSCEVYAIGFRNYEQGIMVYGTDNVIDGCEISNMYGVIYNQLGIGIVLSQFYATDNLVQNCDIHDCDIGIMVLAPSGNTFRANRIHNNSRLGIDLGDNTGIVTPNDPLDADTGSNDLQNFPVLEYVVFGSPGIVGGMLETEPMETCVIEFFASAACHSKGHGEGEIYLGSETVTTGGSGIAHFQVHLPSVPEGHVVTATATNSRGSTSEFSACCSATPSVHIVTITTNFGPGSLDYAIDEANNNPDLSLIQFNIPGTGPHTIQPTHGMTLVHPTIIDGFSQPGASSNTTPPGQPDDAVIMIEIDGSSWNLPFCFQVTTGMSSVIRGLAIYNIGNTAIYLSNTEAAFTRIEGCRIGTDAAGMTARSNFYGVASYAPGCVIGGSTPGTRNIIVASQYDGIAIMSASDQIVWNNYIGVAADGATALPNGGSGIYVEPGATGIKIGGLDPGQQNVIANNGNNGVIFYPSKFIKQNPILGNSIYNNANLGIDLGGSGVTPNDPGDTDDGANSLQNYPVLLSVDPSAAGTRIQGELNSNINESFRLEFFSNDVCDALGYGEGKIFLGADSVETDPGPLVVFDITLPIVVPGGVWITATATDSQGNTSEFSQCIEVINTEAGTSVVVDPPDENGETPMTLTFDQVDTEGNTSLSSSGTCSSLPGSFEVSDPPVCYEVTTDATFTGMIEVCVQYDEDALTGDEADVVLIHFDAGIPGWVDITTSVDTDLNIVCGQVSGLSPFAVGTEIASGAGDNPVLPATNALYQNVPNPFNPTTTIRYNIVEDVHVRLSVYDVAGRLVRTLVDENQRANLYQVTWQGVNDAGQTVATGIYFYRITARSFTQTRKMLLLK